MADETKETVGFSLRNTPGIEAVLVPAENPSSRVNDAKIRRLYLQATAQQWFAPDRLCFTGSPQMEDDAKEVWARFMTIFYTLEKMGLNVIENMAGRAARRLRSDEVAYYLTAQAADEARHVFAIENYLKRMGAPPQYDRTFHVLGQVASMGIYRVENWMFSTLFSENFASVFLRKARTARIDELGAEMCRSFLIDESRHLHFLHIALPDVMEDLSLLGRTYVKASQFFIMKFTEIMARRLDVDAARVGLNRKELLEEVFSNVERAYESFGVSRRFLAFPRVGPVAVS